MSGCVCVYLPVEIAVSSARNQSSLKDSDGEASEDKLKGMADPLLMCGSMCVSKRMGVQKWGGGWMEKWVDEWGCECAGMNVFPDASAVWRAKFCYRIGGYRPDMTCSVVAEGEHIDACYASPDLLYAAQQIPDL